MHSITCSINSGGGFSTTNVADAIEMNEVYNGSSKTRAASIIESTDDRLNGQLGYLQSIRIAAEVKIRPNTATPDTYLAVGSTRLYTFTVNGVK